MKKILISLLVLAAALSCGPAQVEDLPMAVAHRGCWLQEGGEFYINENCPAGVRMAAQYGYPAIECDVKYTLDSVMVVMHDGTINRTMRNAADYSLIEEPVKVSEHTFDDLRTNYVLASTDPSLRTPIPTLKELLEACEEYGITPMLHSAVPESYKLASEMLGDGFIAFDASQAAVSQARKYSSCLILLDPGKDPAERTIERLKEIGGVCGMSTMKYDMLDAEYIKTIKDAGFEVQASIFRAPHEQRALSDGVTIELSDFYWHQTENREPVAAFKKSNKKLSEGEIIEWTTDAPDFAALVIEADFSGSLEFSINGRVYELTRETPGKVEVFGTRLYKSNPDIKVKALGDAVIKSIKAELYNCGE